MQKRGGVLSLMERPTSEPVEKGRARFEDKGYELSQRQK